MTELLYKELTYSIIGAAMEVHTILGPGFLESVYQTSLESELALRKIPFERKVKLPVTYKGIEVGIFEADLAVDGKVIVEIKAVSKFSGNHHAQAMHYLTATGLRLALLLNFGGGSLDHRRVIR